MNWQFGDDEVVIEPLDIPDNPPPARRPTPRRRRRTWLLIFLIALAAAWTTGFYLGRLQQTTTALEAQIQGQLDIESWAWQQDDWELFRSLLPRRTPSWRLATVRAMFNATAPQQRDMTLLDYIVSDDGFQVEVIAQVTTDRRRYKVKNATQRTSSPAARVWQRRPPSPRKKVGRRC